MIAADPRLIVSGDHITQDGSTQAIYHRLNLLPWAVLNKLSKFYRRYDKRERDVEEVCSFLDQNVLF